MSWVSLLHLHDFHEDLWITGWFDRSMSLQSVVKYGCLMIICVNVLADQKYPVDSVMCNFTKTNSTRFSYHFLLIGSWAFRCILNIPEYSHPMQFMVCILSARNFWYHFSAMCRCPCLCWRLSRYQMHWTCFLMMTVSTSIKRGNKYFYSLFILYVFIRNQAYGDEGPGYMLLATLPFHICSLRCCTFSRI